MIDYGSHASIRTTEQGRFPILKLAHSDELSIKLIQHEFDVLAELTKLGLPVLRLPNGKALQTRSVGVNARTDDIKQTLDRIHSAGFSHGDFGPSNIMTDEGGRLIFIDVSFAGRLGSAVPSFFPSWVYTDGTYSIGSDLERFGRYMVSV
jgi:tRNA A-37 threonylcarbamoyl transferase component Bud32